MVVVGFWNVSIYFCMVVVELLEFPYMVVGLVGFGIFGVWIVPKVWEGIFRLKLSISWLNESMELQVFPLI